MRSRSWTWKVDFNSFNGKAQVRQTTVSCDSSLPLVLNIRHGLVMIEIQGARSDSYSIHQFKCQRG